MRAAANAPRQHNAPKRPQSQLFMKEPDEPDWSHPEHGHIDICGLAACLR